MPTSPSRKRVSIARRADRRQLVFALVVTASCGGDASSTQPASSATSATSAVARAPDLVATVFEITEYTINEVGCDAPGPSALETLGSDKLVVFWDYEAFGQKIVQTVTCKERGECAATLTAARAGKMPQSRMFHMFNEVVDATHRKGIWAMTGFLSDDKKTCEDAATGTLSLEQVGDVLDIEVRLTKGSTEPTSNGMCSTDVATKTLGSKPCNHLTRIHAVSRGAL